MRKRSPALDAFLYKFQYTSTLVNPLALSIGMEAIEQYDFQSLHTTRLNDDDIKTR